MDRFPADLLQASPQILRLCVLVGVSGEVQVHPFPEGGVSDEVVEHADD